MNKEYICYEGKSFKYFDYIDNYFRKLVVNKGAHEYQIPAIIDEEVLVKCGYFQSFPQHITVAAYVDDQKYDEVMSNKSISKSEVEVDKKYFTPAACLHLYPLFEGKNVENTILTTRARVYRHENGKFDGSVRFWDFTVREIVFLGSKEYVISMLEKMKDEVIKLGSNIKLPIKICAAYDNFYPNASNKIKQKLQQGNALKYEVTTMVDEKDVAIASFNYHGTHFSKPFNFDNDGTIVSGCVGFGLERWVTAMNEYNVNWE